MIAGVVVAMVVCQSSSRLRPVRETGILRIYPPLPGIHRHSLRAFVSAVGEEEEEEETPCMLPQDRLRLISAQDNLGKPTEQALVLHNRRAVLRFHSLEEGNHTSPVFLSLMIRLYLPDSAGEGGPQDDDGGSQGKA
jgi:hypothetical protein